MLQIDALLSDGRYHPVSEIEEFTGKSEPTVKRDIAALRDINAPIEYDKYNGGYHYTETSYRIPVTFIPQEDMAVYGVIRRMFDLYRNTPLWKPLRDILDTLEYPVENNSSARRDGDPDIRLATGNLPPGHWFEDRIVIAEKPRITVDETEWEIILSALMHNTKLEFDYVRNYDNADTHRVVEPWQLVFDDQDWFITGFCELRKSRRMFLLSKIKNLKAVDEHFTLPPDGGYKLEKRSLGKFGASIGGERRTYRIMLKDGSFVTAGQQWADDWRQEPYQGPLADTPYAAVVTFTSNQHIPIMRWVLSHGEDAVPLDPPEFVAAWKKHLSAMNNLADKLAESRQ